MGSLYGRAKILKDSGNFFSSFRSSEKGCAFSFRFSKTKVEIITSNDQDDCEFGFGVYADGVFQRKSNKKAEYFEDREGKRIYFEKTRPEDYYKE
jgi:hypothetical protein